MKKIQILTALFLAYSVNASELEHKFYFSNDINIEATNIYSDTIKEEVRILKPLKKVDYAKEYKIVVEYTGAPKTSKDKLNEKLNNRIISFENESFKITPETLYQLELVHSENYIIDVNLKEVELTPEISKNTTDIVFKINNERKVELVNYKKTMELDKNIVLKKNLNSISISFVEKKYIIK